MSIGSDDGPYTVTKTSAVDNENVSNAYAMKSVTDEHGEQRLDRRVISEATWLNEKCAHASVKPTEWKRVCVADGGYTIIDYLEGETIAHCPL